MKYFFSSPVASIKALRQGEARRFLFSFAVDGKGIHRHSLPTDDIIIDSGAFTLWNKGEGEIDIEEYLAFCNSIPKGNVVCINLDVIPETGSSQSEIDKCCEQGFENFKWLRERCIHPVLPVYHYGEDIKWLIRFQKECDFVGISPANDTHENTKRKFLSYVFKHWDKKTKFHGLGYSSKSGLMMFPFYSVDSISYKRRIHRNSKGKNRSIIVAIKALNSLLVQNIKAFIKMEEDVTSVWESRGIKWDE